MTQSLNSEAIARVQYQCRRGMLELDVFLMPFCANCFVGLTETQQQLFIELLKEPDPDLFTWLMGYGEAKNEYIKLIEKIRHYQLSKKAK